MIIRQFRWRLLFRGVYVVSNNSGLSALRLGDWESDRQINTKGSKKGIRCPSAWCSVFRIGLGKLDQPVTPRCDLLLPSAPSGDDGSNAEDKSHTLWDVTITGT